MNFDNTYRNLPERFFAKVSPAVSPSPELIAFNGELGKDLGLDYQKFSQEELAQIFSGNQLLDGSEPLAMAYAGHQFGHFVPQLGDGRALLLGEVKNKKGHRFDVQLKGSGQTPFSRNGDGRSALGPVIREYILSEAMAQLGIPTTRALAAVSTGELVLRDPNRGGETPGGVFTRVASSHIRIGTFQFFAARGDNEALKDLFHYSLKRHYPELVEQNNPVLHFLNSVAKRQADLIARWMRVGFIHGVMNTDNMTISGETIDYGPCAFMDHFNYKRTYSYIDRQGRYSYMNQAPIAHWNLTRLAECLVPLIEEKADVAVDQLNQALAKLPDLFKEQWDLKMTAKLGLDNTSLEDQELVKLFLNYLEKEELDFTRSFKAIEKTLNGKPTSLPETEDYLEFQQLWQSRVNSPEESLAIMKKTNPLYIPRNHLVERAIEEAVRGQYDFFHQMNQVLSDPFNPQDVPKLFEQAPLPEEIVQNTFCGT